MTVATLTPRQQRFLTQLFPGEDCLLRPEQTLVFASDASQLQGCPLAVVRPQRASQLGEFMAWAQQEQMPVYPRARGSNVVGDCVPDPPGVVVSFLKMNRILDLARDDYVAIVEPGVVTAGLQRQAEALGLFYPPDPASVRLSTIGGNVATCAGGMRALKYGVTRDYVLGMNVVLPGGQNIRLGGRTHKNVVGLDLVRLFVGSAGTLGLMSEITLKLLPRPEATVSLLAAFADLAHAVEAGTAIFAAGILPAALEFMNRTTLDCLARRAPLPWPEPAEAALLIQLDGSRDALGHDLQRLRRVVASHAPLTLLPANEPEAEHALWDLRRSIHSACFACKPDKLSDDITLPRGRLKDAVLGIRDIALARTLAIPVFGHFGDGNLHVNIMHDAADPAELSRARDARAEVTDLTLRLHGTLSGEHGIGLTKLPSLDRQLGPLERELMRRVKHVFDPCGIMNPGKGF